MRLIVACICALESMLANAFVHINFRGHQQHIQFDPNHTDASVRELYYMEALLDHFAPVSETSYWSQRYYVNEEFWGGMGFPVFLYIGGEGPLTASTLTARNFIYTLAKSHRALLVAVEHRFYGKSYPKPDMSIENLRFLTSDQALADLARIHSHLSREYGLKTSHWVAFGGSYPGALAAWFKLKYPHLVSGSIASSAPILAKEDFYEYMEVVGSGLRYFGGGKCYKSVERSMQILHSLIVGKAEQKKLLVDLFHPCQEMRNEYDISVFESNIMSLFQDISQYNQLRYGQLTLHDVCEIFARNHSIDFVSQEQLKLVYGGSSVPDPEASVTSNNALRNLVAFVDKTKSKDCIDSIFEGHVNATIDLMKNTTFDGLSSTRQWFYQTCNEFGYFQTTSSAQSPFFALKSVRSIANVGNEICKRVFKMPMHPGIPRINNHYGALKINVQNVTFPSGTIDPWHVLAVQNTTILETDSARPVYIEGSAHCADMRAPQKNDSTSMKWAHEQISQAVAYYISAKFAMELS